MPVDCRSEADQMVKLEAQGGRHPSVELQGAQEVWAMGPLQVVLMVLEQVQ